MKVHHSQNRPPHHTHHTAPAEGAEEFTPFAPSPSWRPHADATSQILTLLSLLPLTRADPSCD